MHRPIIAVALLLTACGGQRVPLVETKVVEVPVEVQRPCRVTKPVRPAPLARPLPTDLGQLVVLLGRKLAEYADPGKYADRAEKAIDICTKE